MLLNKKYEKVLPTREYLLDEVILLNAWKKAHQYIRNVNWYVDYLDLDKSALEIENRIRKLIHSLKNEKLSLSLLRLIPVPKAKNWDFKPSNNNTLNWHPVEEKKIFNSKKNSPLTQPMRPLAHVAIDDQTVFTAIMILLADQVEEIQGDPSTDFDKVHTKKIINYGNRLHCNYSSGSANYSWGNSNTYSKFFQDYQTFLSRPIYFGREAKRIKTNDEEIYEIHLDFAKFYDNIDRSKLVATISKLIRECTGEAVDSCIQHVLAKFSSWSWEKSSFKLYEEVCRNDDLPELINCKGIPQGLVAGGFFANIYMLIFDKKISSIIGKALSVNSNIMVVDACRYVDDLRLIVKVNKNLIKRENIAYSITLELKEIIKELGLHIQDSKTKVKVFNSKEGAVSTKMANIQGKVSGPLPLTEIDEQLGHLEGLIELSDNLDINNIEFESLSASVVNELAFIDKPFNDVRKDTLLRFTANKIHKLLSQKRNMISQEVNDAGTPIPGGWDYLQEKMARKLIGKWTRDPSLVLLMKKGIELFPSVSLLRPLLANLDSIRIDNNKKDQVLLAEYCISEIFRHSATAIHTKDKWAFPAQSNINDYFEYLENYASKMLLDLDEVNEALREQVMFFCLVRNISALDFEVDSKEFNLITKILNGYRNISVNLNANELVTMILLAYQMSLDKRKVVKSVIGMIESIYERFLIRSASNPFIIGSNSTRTKLFSVCKLIMLGEPNLFEELFLTSKKQNLKWVNDLMVNKLIEYLEINSNSKIRDELSKYNHKYISLLSVLRMDDSPFKHENGILKLLQSTIKELKEQVFNKPIDIGNSKVSCSDWDDVLKLNSSCKLDLRLSFYSEENVQFHSPPQWLTKEHEPLYYIGMFVRSSLLGVIDWSSNLFQSSNRSAYKGIRTNLLKRQVGMIHSPESFGDSKSPMSNWLSSLLFKLLQWPGVENNNNNYKWPEVWDLTSLGKLINERVLYQSGLYCHLSRTPLYIEKVNLDWPRGKKHLHVVMAQPLLPLLKDFDDFGMRLDCPKYRARHRRHVASVADLILHTISSKDSMNEKPIVKGKVDLIIWPELSVSPDDFDILERLSDKTGAIIFSGVVFNSIASDKMLNNSAIWIIPNKKSSGRRFVKRLQGKWNMTAEEKKYIEPWRPYQLIVELMHPDFPDYEGFKLTGSICYDATDIKLSADLKEKSHAFIISAMNKDIGTFDSMVDSLYYHMYQFVILVNSGEFGGSAAKAPYKEKFHKLITHVHGAHQVSISTFEMNMFDFREHGNSMKSTKMIKTPPAGGCK